MRVITLDKNSHLKFHSISLAFLVRKKDQKQISLEITRQRNKHGMTRNLMFLMSFFLLKETMIIFWRHVFENISFILFKSTSMNWYISTINRVTCFKWSQVFEKVMQKFRYTILIGQTNDTKILSDQRGSHSWTGFFQT